MYVWTNGWTISGVAGSLIEMSWCSCDATVMALCFFLFSCDLVRFYPHPHHLTIVPETVKQSWKKGGRCITWIHQTLVWPQKKKKKKESHLRMTGPQVPRSGKALIRFITWGEGRGQNARSGWLPCHVLGKDQVMAIDHAYIEEGVPSYKIKKNIRQTFKFWKLLWYYLKNLEHMLINMFSSTFVPNFTNLTWKKMSPEMPKLIGSLNAPLCTYLMRPL